MQQFHQRGYISTEPRLQPAAGFGVNRPDDIPENVDVLIVGAGPAGMIAAAQLSQFPGINTRLIERRGHRLELGHADGVASRSVETFSAFGFANQIIEEGHHITQTAFWNPDPENPENIIRTQFPEDDATSMSEFPHLCVNQARVQDYFAQFAYNSPTRFKPDFGWEFTDLTIHKGADAGDYPVEVHMRRSVGENEGDERTVHAKYVYGCDGARSLVRASIGRKLVGGESLHAWGVMDIICVSDFPDIRTKCAIQSHSGGNILMIPREGGHLVRFYVDLGEVAEDDNGKVRETPIETSIARANEILHPYSIDVRNVAWYSVYEVAHRVTDKFDDVTPNDPEGTVPRVFIAGDACHTHSAKAGQGMNVSMQDGWNLAWKLGHVLEGRADVKLLDTYSDERQVIAQNLIDFDKEWSTLMATKPEDFPDPNYLSEYYVKTFEFPAGFLTKYPPALLTGTDEYQDLAKGFPIGKRFHSEYAVRVSDGSARQIGHFHLADGRWRIYVFADPAAPALGGTPTAKFAEWLKNDPASPLAPTPADGDENAWFDVKVIYQQDFAEIDHNNVPDVFKPVLVPYGVRNLENTWAKGVRRGQAYDLFESRGIDPAGAIVVVRPDQYVAQVLPLTATDKLASFFAALR